MGYKTMRKGPKNEKKKSRRLESDGRERTGELPKPKRMKTGSCKSPVSRERVRKKAEGKAKKGHVQRERKPKDSLQSKHSVHESSLGGEEATAAGSKLKHHLQRTT